MCTYFFLFFFALAATDKIQVYVHIAKWRHQRKAVLERKYFNQQLRNNFTDSTDHEAVFRKSR